MSKIIKINSIAAVAMTEDAGMQLRQKISEVLQEKESVILDFEGIELFATPFFNSSIGYFIMHLSPEKYKEYIQVINLSDLGRETYSHSYQNALSVYNNNIDEEMIGKITSETIEEK